jgi:DDE superfamily endonuclease
VRHVDPGLVWPGVAPLPSAPFFTAARWCPQQVKLVLAELIVIRTLAPGAPITVAVDDTLFRRRRKKVHGAG